MLPNQMGVSPWEACVSQAGKAGSIEEKLIVLNDRGNQYGKWEINF